jgi:transaldolase
MPIRLAIWDRRQMPLRIFCSQAGSVGGRCFPSARLAEKIHHINLPLPLPGSTGTKDPKVSDILYIKALASPFTVNTMPEETLKALADHVELGKIMAADGGDCEKVLAEFAKAGINVDALAAQLQDEGAKSFVKS